MRIVKVAAVGSTSLAVGAVAGIILMAGAGCGAMTNNRPDPTLSAQSACAGIAPKERELGLMAYREAIAGARPLRDDSMSGKARIGRERGTAVLFRAEPNLSVAWLGRVNACHADLVAAGQVTSSAVTTDPFVVPGTTVSIAETQMGYDVSVRASSDQGMVEVAHRVAGLSTGDQVATAMNAR
jgi:hypothetical protein